MGVDPQGSEESGTSRRPAVRAAARSLGAGASPTRDDAGADSERGAARPEEDPPLRGAGTALARPDGADGSTSEIERLFELTGDPLATISAEGRFTLLNPAWEQLLGRTRRGAARGADRRPAPSRRRRAGARRDPRPTAPPAREHDEPLPPPRRLVALADVERASRRRHLVRDGQGRDGSHVARAPGAARPAHATAEPAAVHGPRAPGDRPPAPQRQRRGDAVHRPRQVQGGQRQPRAQRRRSPAGRDLRTPCRADARQRHGGPAGRR